MTGKPVPLSLRRKSAARLAAVQCVYRVKMNDEFITPEALFEDYLAQWEADKTSANRAMSYDAAPDKSLFLKLLSGVMEKKEALDETIQSSLNEKWKKERMSPLLLAILACAIFELKYLTSGKPLIAINEYVTLTGRFFEPAEVGFVNGVLDKISKS